jgi:hypothetical protein
MCSAQCDGRHVAFGSEVVHCAVAITHDPADLCAARTLPRAHSYNGLRFIGQLSNAHAYALSNSYSVSSNYKCESFTTLQVRKHTLSMTCHRTRVCVVFLDTCHRAGDVDAVQHD